MTDRKLVSIAKEFRKGMLGGRSSKLMCAAICWPLQSFLSLQGVQAHAREGLVGNLNHVWLELPDGRVLDPTADQFNAKPFDASVAKYPQIYLGAPLAIHRIN